MSARGAVMRKTARNPLQLRDGEFVSGVSITSVKRLTSVNSVYSVNNFSRMCNVNLLIYCVDMESSTYLTVSVPKSKI